MPSGIRHSATYAATLSHTQVVNQLLRYAKVCFWQKVLEGD